MKKFVCMLVIAVIAFSTCAVAFAESTQSELKRVKNLAEYYGYDLSVKKLNSSLGKLRFSNSRGEYTVYVKPGKDCLIYRYGNKTAKFAGLEKALKKFSVEQDRILMATEKVQCLGDKLESYAELWGYNVVGRYCHMGKKPYDVVSFNNGHKTYVVKITGELKNKTVAISYEWDGKAVTAKTVASRIQKYSPGMEFFGGH